MYPVCVCVCVKQAVNDHCRREKEEALVVAAQTTGASPAHRTRSRAPMKVKDTVEVVSKDARERNIQNLLGTHRMIRWAWKNPQQYLLCLSHLVMVIELVSLMTPMIAVGIQWITSLCHTMPPVTALLSVFYLMLQCVLTGESECSALQNHCIVSPAGVFAST